MSAARSDRSAADRHELLAGYGVLAVSAGIALGVIALLVQQGRDRPFEVVLLIAGALAVAFGWQTLLRTVPVAAPLAVEVPPRQLEPPPSQRRVENVVSFACSRAVDAHMLLRPILRDIAAERLSAHAVDLDNDARASVMLGPWAWALLRHDLPEPEDWHAPGLDPAALVRVVEALERL
jgi:hypothetical protein